LPLLTALAPHFKVVGFDVKKERVQQLCRGVDNTGEVDEATLKSIQAEFSSDPKSISQAKFIIVAVPTPVKEGNVPDMGLVEKATSMVGQYLTKDSVVVFESTVYPGATEEICLPLLEQHSGLKGGTDFKIGYSPERVNPGDREHTIDRVVKVVSGMDDESLDLISEVYGAVTHVFRAASIRVAEAAKVIENTQRDLNIALMNELARIFCRMGFSIYDVLAAANTKWNFLRFTPGLVGGHCIGVDPYYLTFKAQALGYQPEVVLAGRRTNDSMGEWVVQEIMKKIIASGQDVSRLKVLIAGMTFKENVPDVRNSKVYDIFKEFKNYGIVPQVYDPIADKQEVKREYGIELVDLQPGQVFDLIVFAVGHKQFQVQPLSYWKNYLQPNGLMADIKQIFNRQDVAEANINHWTL
jgi:UDP-N-acetyl-D-glucosamine/UDP-N-acetyl-D-galactosamine dehydrogenase